MICFVNYRARFTGHSTGHATGHATGHSTGHATGSRYRALYWALYWGTLPGTLPGTLRARFNGHFNGLFNKRSSQPATHPPTPSPASHSGSQRVSQSRLQREGSVSLEIVPTCFPENWLALCPRNRCSGMLPKSLSQQKNSKKYRARMAASARAMTIRRQIMNSPVISAAHGMLISTDHGMLISTDHVMLISTAWLNMTILWTTEGRPRSGRPCVFHRIVMSSQAVEINMTWSVDINMSWSVDINMP